MVEALGDRDSDIQTHASWALTAIGPDAREAIPSLVQLIRAEQARVYEPRYSFLRTPNGQVLKMEYRPALEVERSVVAAIEALSCIDVEGKTVLPVLIGALTEHFSFFREASADSLMNLGPSARPAAPMLLTCLDDSDDSVRLAAAGAYWRATGEVERPLDVFSDVFSRLRMPRYARHREASPRWRKDIRVLREMAGAARRDVRTAGAKLKLITALVAMLDMPDPELQAAAQDALDTIFSDGSTEAAAVAAWKRTSEVVRHTDSEALKSLGGPEQALPKLQLYLQLPSWVAPDKDEAAGLLVSCGADKAAAILAEALPSPEVEMRRVAASAIPFCPTAKSALIHALDDTDEIVRARVARVMGSSPPGDPEVLALLTEALGDISGEARVSAAVALLRISKEHAEAKSVLDECMEGQDAGLRRYFMWEMRNRGMALSPGILQLLLKGLGDRYYDVRESAAWTLCGFGPAAKSAIPALEALAEKDPSEEVRKSAAEAIRAIRRGPEEPEK
jgi:HEAT repeat protein